MVVLLWLGNSSLESRVETFVVYNCRTTLKVCRSPQVSLRLSFIQDCPYQHTTSKCRQYMVCRGHLRYSFVLTLCSYGLSSSLARSLRCRNSSLFLWVMVQRQGYHDRYGDSFLEYNSDEVQGSVHTYYYRAAKVAQREIPPGLP